MTFTTISFFFAGLLAALAPIVIHLLTKGKPRKVVFSALMFAQAKLASNRRSFALKRLLLLASRVALLALLGLALSRPYFAPRPTTRATAADETSDSDDSTLNENDEVTVIGRDAPVAATIVIDTSPRMGRVTFTEQFYAQVLIASQMQFLSILYMLVTFSGSDGYELGLPFPLMAAYALIDEDELLGKYELMFLGVLAYSFQLAVRHSGIKIRTNYLY